MRYPRQTIVGVVDKIYTREVSSHFVEGAIEILHKMVVTWKREGLSFSAHGSIPHTILAELQVGDWVSFTAALRVDGPAGFYGAFHRPGGAKIIAKALHNRPRKLGEEPLDSLTNPRLSYFNTPIGR
jgi:hypothetical protein